MTFYFITHPNVVVSRDVPVPRWPLSEPGRRRMHAGLKQPWVRDLTAIYCSTEQKAIDGAEILASHLSLPFQQVEDLGENDRSATGFLPPEEFERVADQFFAHPEQSIHGWERAVDAISPASRSTAAGTSRRMAAATTTASRCLREKYSRGGTRSTPLPR